MRTYRLTFLPSHGQPPLLIECTDVVFTSGFALFREEYDLIYAYPALIIQSIELVTEP